MISRPTNSARRKPDPVSAGLAGQFLDIGIRKRLDSEHSSDLPTIMLDDRQGFTRYLGPQRTCVPFEVCAADKTLYYSLSFVSRPVPLSDLVSMANQLSQAIVDATSRRIEESDCRIACRKGCDACCYYMVPISPAEAFHIRNEIYRLPQVEQRILFQSCQNTARQLLERRVPKHLISPTQGPEERLEALSDWYKELKLPCPFLVNHSCSIYEFRPLACREYLVTSHPNKCRPETTEAATQVLMPVRIAEVLAETCRILEGSESSILLTVLPAFLQDVSERSWRLYPAEQLISTFLEVLTDCSQRYCVAAQDHGQI